jgi:hypothetical protein
MGFLRVAKRLKIESLILDHECVRGANQEEGTLIIHREHLPNFEFAHLGLNRLDVLESRFKLLSSKYSVIAELKEKTPLDIIVSKMVISSGRTKMDFRCVDPATMVKAPKNLKDPLAYSFTVDAETVELLNRAQSSFRKSETIAGNTVTFASTGSAVTSTLMDIAGDTFDHEVASTVTYFPPPDSDVVPAPTPFKFTYKNGILMGLLREVLQGETINITITRRGMLKLTYEGIPVFVTPEA